MRRKWIHTIWLALLIGLLNGLIGAIFLGVIKGAIYFVDEWSVPVYLLPLLGGMILLLFKGRMMDDHVDFGIWAVKEELYYIDRQVMVLRDVAFRFVGTLISILAGFSVGRFSPMIYIGGAVGSEVGYRFGLDEDEIKLFIGCGVAGTLSAIFQDPIFATIFVLEIFLHDSYFDRIPAIMLSSLVSMEVAFLFLGEFSPFGALADYLTYDKTSIIIAIILGLVTGVLTYYYNVMILHAKNFHKNHNQQFFPVVGGILIGGIAFAFPEIIELYTDFFTLYLSENILLTTILILIALKFVTIFISFAFGAIGGTFAPAMYIGFLLGVLVMNMTGVSSSAIIGMCGMFAGFANAPLAATIFFTSISGIGKLVVPFFIVSIISTTVHKLLDHKLEAI